MTKRTLLLALGITAGAVLIGATAIGVAFAGGWLDDPRTEDDEILVERGDPTAETATATPTATPAVFEYRFDLPALQAQFRAALALTDLAPETARYAAALEARDAGDHDLAERLFRHTVEADGPLASMANLRLGQLLVANDEGSRAVAPFAATRAETALPLPNTLRSVALTEAAGNLVDLDRGEEALPLLAEAAALPGATTFEQADTLWAAARVRRDLQDPAWTEDAIEAMRIAPLSPAALEALDALTLDDVEPPLMVAALVEYRWRRDTEAIERYEAALAGGTLTPEETGAAWFYLGALAERELDREGAIEAYAESLAAAPNGPQAPDARYWRGRVYEELDDPAAAAIEYDQLLVDYPDATFVPDARLRAALALGFAGSPDEAVARLEEIAATADPVRAAEAARWHHVMRTRFNATTAMVLDPRTHHPAVLWSLLDDETTSPLPTIAAAEHPAPFSPLTAAEIEEIETWLQARHGPRDPLAPSVLDHASAVLGLALVEAGEPAVGRTLLFQVASEHAQQPYALLDLGLEAEHRALYDVSMSIGNRLLIPVTAHARLDAPRPLLRLAYPAPFVEEVTTAVEGTSLPPLLLLAVIRQESQFNPDATSPVGAVGLGQVMPGTGEEIARQLGEAWDPASLRNPATSLRYGAHYLAAQLEAFDGNILATLGAYNAGPGSAARWLEDQPFEGPDGFLHGIDFTQTRTYLEHVLENYAWYRYLYAGTPAPMLRGP